MKAAAAATATIRPTADNTVTAVTAAIMVQHKEMQCAQCCSYCSLPHDSNCFSLFRQFKFARSGAVHRDDVAAGSVEMDGNVSNGFVTLLLPLPIPTAMARSVAEPLCTAAHWFCAQSLGSEAVGNLCQNQARQNGENQTKTAELELCNALSQN